MGSFELSYNLLSVPKLELGKIAIMPWDSEIFKFKVAQYELGDIDYIRGKATPAQVLGKSHKRANKLSPEAYNANILKSLSFMETL